MVDEAERVTPLRAGSEEHKFAIIPKGSSALTIRLLSRYAVTGGAGTLFSIVGFALLIEFDWWERNYILAATFLILLWTPFAFALQQHWVFENKEPRRVRRFFVFFLSGIPMHFVGLLFLSLLVEVGQLDELISKVFAAGSVALLQFLISWVGIFRIRR